MRQTEADAPQRVPPVWQTANIRDTLRNCRRHRSVSLFHLHPEQVKRRVSTAWTRLVIRVVEHRSLRRSRQDLRAVGRWRKWRASGPRPHRGETFEPSTDRYVVDKDHDVVGPYPDPPERTQSHPLHPGCSHEAWMSHSSSDPRGCLSVSIRASSPGCAALGPVQTTRSPALINARSDPAFLVKVRAVTVRFGNETWAALTAAVANSVA